MIGGVDFDIARLFHLLGGIGSHIRAGKNGDRRIQIGGGQVGDLVFVAPLHVCPIAEIPFQRLTQAAFAVAGRRIAAADQNLHGMAAGRIGNRARGTIFRHGDSFDLAHNNRHIGRGLGVHQKLNRHIGLAIGRIDRRADRVDT